MICSGNRSVDANEEMAMTGSKWTDDEIAIAVRILNDGEERARGGEARPFDPPIYRAGLAAFVQPACEAIIVDPARACYWLTRRPEGDAFGSGKLHIMGGMSKAGCSSLSANAQTMAKEEMGLTDIRLLAPCIARFQWTKYVNHAYGDPFSLVDVYEAVGTPAQKPDIVCFKVGAYPRLEDMINYRTSGEIHLKFLQVFHRWLNNPCQPCIDLNVNWDF